MAPMCQPCRQQDSGSCRPCLCPAQFPAPPPPADKAQPDKAATSLAAPACAARRRQIPLCSHYASPASIQSLSLTMAGSGCRQPRAGHRQERGGMAAEAAGSLHRAEPAGMRSPGSGHMHAHAAFRTKANTSLRSGSNVCHPSCLGHAVPLPRCPSSMCLAPGRAARPSSLRRCGFWPLAACWRLGSGSLAAPAMACVH